MRHPLVSVIIPTFNRAESCRSAIFSVLNQTYTNLEVVVVDDASTDDTRNKIASIASPNLVYERLANNGGASRARNVGIDIAKGEYITFLDSDDEYLPDKVEAQVKRLEEAGESYGVANCGRIDQRDDVPYRIWNPSIEGNVTALLLSKRHVGAGTPFLMVRASLIKANRIYFNPDLPAGQDWDFLLKVSQHTKLAVVSKPLVKVNHHSGKRVFSYKTARIAAEMQYNAYKELIVTDKTQHQNFIYYVSKYIFLDEGGIQSREFLNNEFNKYWYSKNVSFLLWWCYFRFFRSSGRISSRALHLLNRRHFGIER